MNKHSHFFQTIYNQDTPVGHLGRGTHYSVLRAVIFTDLNQKLLDEAFFHDFAIIWDEDHDERIIKVVEQLYFKGLLPSFTIIGERKGMLTIISNDHTTISTQRFQREVSIATESIQDCWSVENGTITNPESIISDAPDKVSLYLRGIDMLWNLGKKPAIK